MNSKENDNISKVEYYRKKMHDLLNIINNLTVISTDVVDTALCENISEATKKEDLSYANKRIQEKVKQIKEFMEILRPELYADLDKYDKLRGEE